MTEKMYFIVNLETGETDGPEFDSWDAADAYKRALGLHGWGILELATGARL